MTTVSRRARHFRDRSGDPLDGLVNLFDVGVVLAVAFLLAALSAPAIAGRIGRSTTPGAPATPTPTSPGQTVRPVPSNLAPGGGYGTPIGRVYRLPDGRLVYVVPSSALPPSVSPGGSSPAPSSPAATPTR